MRKYFLVLLLIILFPSPVYAVTVTIISAPPSAGEEKFSVTAQIDGASAGTNYLRLDLYADGTKNYFGETDNGQSWNNSSDGKQYFPITIVSGISNIATVSGRIGDPSLTDYPGPGSYKLRVRRYTSSGSTGSEEPVPVFIQLTKTWPSPSPSPLPSPSPSPSPSLVPSPTPTPSPTYLPTPSPKPSLKPSPSPSPDLTPAPVGTVAGLSTEINLSDFGVSPSPTMPEIFSQAPKINHSRAKTVIIIGSALILISLAGFFGYRKYLATIDK